MVVPVLITSCHVLDQSNNGPVTAQIMIVSVASMNACGCPAAEATRPEIRSKKSVMVGPRQSDDWRMRRLGGAATGSVDRGLSYSDRENCRPARPAQAQRTSAGRVPRTSCFSTTESPAFKGASVRSWQPSLEMSVTTASNRALSAGQTLTSRATLRRAPSMARPFPTLVRRVPECIGAL